MPQRPPKRKVRFAHVDRAGIVFYPRFVEMLCDAFPRFAQYAIGSRTELAFRTPAGLGEWLSFRKSDAAPDALLAVDAVSGDQLVFECRQYALADTSACPPRAATFCRDYEIGDWMVDAGCHLHVSRYYELLSETVEDWFSDQVGVPFTAMFVDGGVSTPTVSLITDVLALPKAGERVTMKLAVADLGTSSITLNVTLARDDRALVRTRQVLVTARRDPIGAVPIPEDIVRGIRRHSDAAANGSIGIPTNED